jgi:signal peptidase II
VIGAIAAIVAVDQLTKAWAVAALSDGPVHVIGDTVEFELTRNGGGAFSRFQGMTPVLAVGAIVVTFVLFRVLRRMTDSVLVIALTLVLGGALGNLVDRFVRAPGFLRGHVIDFVSVGWWPVFNVADSCVTIGAVLLIVRSLRAPRVAAARPESGTGRRRDE